MERPLLGRQAYPFCASLLAQHRVERPIDFDEESDSGELVLAKNSPFRMCCDLPVVASRYSAEEQACILLGDLPSLCDLEKFKKIRAAETFSVSVGRKIRQVL